MKTISTGEPSTLGTYRNIAFALAGSEESAAVKFLDEKIQQHGPDAEVIQHESQMVMLILSMIAAELKGESV